ncbi:MAG TPA: hypothetical protein DCS93_09925 [Microscillaceae bacterium]|nr:hypothetical protein [Microscillaceae bacterium]
MADTILSLPPLPQNHRLLLTEQAEKNFQVVLQRKVPFKSLFKPWLLGAIIGFVLGLVALIIYQYESDFAVLSVPFWIISLALFAVFINQLTEQQQLIFSEKQVEIHKKRWMASVKILLQSQDNFDVSLLADKKEKKEKDEGTKVLVPVVFFRMEAFSFFEYASIEEKKWIIEVLQDFKQNPS